MVLFLFHWSKREKSNCCSFLIKMHIFNTYPVAYPSFLCHARNCHCPSQTVGGCFQIYLYIHSCTNLSKYYLKSNLLKNMKWYRTSFVNSESSANVECFSCYYFYFDLNILVPTKKQNKTLDLIATAAFLKEPNWVLFFFRYSYLYTTNSSTTTALKPNLWQILCNSRELLRWILEGFALVVLVALVGWLVLWFKMLNRETFW